MSDMKRVLIIDDSEDDYAVYCRYLGKDYEMRHSSGDKNYLYDVKEFNPHCILLDYHLGTQLGTDFLEPIRNEKNVPVVMLTNEANPQVIIDCMKSGADDYLIKDQITRERLMATIATMIKKFSLQQRVEALERFLPICSACKKIRKKDSNPKSQESWVQMESYISEKTGSQFSHGYCPECYEKARKELHSC